MLEGTPMEVHTCMRPRAVFGTAGYSDHSQEEAVLSDLKLQIYVWCM